MSPAKILRFRCRSKKHHHDRTGRFCYFRAKRGQWLVMDQMTRRRAMAKTVTEARRWIKACLAFNCTIHTEKGPGGIQLLFVNPITASATGMRTK